MNTRQTSEEGQRVQWLKSCEYDKDDHNCLNSKAC